MSDTKAVRFIKYLEKFASLTNKTIKNLNEYDSNNILWFSDIPEIEHVSEIYYNEDDVYAKISFYDEPLMPEIPFECINWVENKDFLLNKKQTGLKSSITEYNFETGESIEQYLENVPQVKDAWDDYIENDWLDWCHQHQEWERVKSIYDTVYRLYNDNLNADQYELVLALGLLTWTDPDGQKIQRHTLTTNIVIEFDVNNREFTIRSSLDPEFNIELDMIDVNYQPLNLEQDINNILEESEMTWSEHDVQSILQKIAYSISSDGLYKNTIQPEFKTKTGNNNIKNDPDINFQDIDQEFYKQNLGQNTEENAEKSEGEDKGENKRESNGEKHNSKNRTKPIVEYAPAIILRKKDEKEYIKALKSIEQQIDNGQKLPSGFSRITESDQEKNQEEQKTDNVPESKTNNQSLTSHSKQINDNQSNILYFPKNSNEQQQRIVQLIDQGDNVVVQGPPGTGKSHTIVNLMCHYLAQGQRILIVSEKERALGVLQHLMPEEILPLSVSFLNDTDASGQSMDNSVKGILENSQNRDKAQEQQTIQQLQSRIEELKSEKQEVEQQIIQFWDNENKQHSITPDYNATPIEAIQTIKKYHSLYDWFEDDLELGEMLPASSEQLRLLSQDLSSFSQEEIQALDYKLPDQNILNIIEQFKNKKQKKFNIKQKLSDLNNENTDQLVQTLINSGCELEILKQNLKQIMAYYQDIDIQNHNWLQDYIKASLKNKNKNWLTVFNEIHKVIAYIETYIGLNPNQLKQLDSKINIESQSGFNNSFKDLQYLCHYFDNGGKLGWQLFQTLDIKKSLSIRKTTYLLNCVYINNTICDSPEKLTQAYRIIRSQDKINRIKNKWFKNSKEKNATDLLNKYKNVVFLSKKADPLIQKLQELFNIIDIDWIREQNQENQNQNISFDNLFSFFKDDDEIAHLLKYCDKPELLEDNKNLDQELMSLEQSLLNIKDDSDMLPVVGTLINNIENNDLDKYDQDIDFINKIREKSNFLERRGYDIEQYKKQIPLLFEKIKSNPLDSELKNCLADIDNAWTYQQINKWLEHYFSKKDIETFTRKLEELENNIMQTISELTSVQAWSHCLDHMKNDHKKHMKTWLQTIRRLGKGKGRHATKYRQEAKKHMKHFYLSIPSMVIPVNKIWDLIPPQSEMFDLVIIDEASQCDIKTAPLYYMGKKVLVVGDDEQVTPNAPTFSEEEEQKINNQFLYDFDFINSGVGKSLFDIAKIHSVDEQIMLKEHFRCMPEIIQFSNDLCYSDNPLIPLRQYGADRLTPLEQVYVEDGVSYGHSTLMYNKEEASAVANRIIQICNDDQYKNKTLGVIFLTSNGKNQSDEINQLLDKDLSKDERVRRRLVFGTASDFQGDERDIILLSLIVSPKNDRSKSRLYKLSNKDDNKKRFNVAASRAKDKMILFHSMTRDELSPGCLRRNLLEFFESGGKQEQFHLTIEDIEKTIQEDDREIINPPIPFENWLEVDVAYELLKNDYKVIPKYTIANNSIDIVVQGQTTKMAIECYGGSGLDQMEQNNQTMEQWNDELVFQQKLRRCGWNFHFILESEFVHDKADVLAKLYKKLKENNIEPLETINKEEAFDSETEIFEQDIDRDYCIHNANDGFYQLNSTSVNSDYIDEQTGVQKTANLNNQKAFTEPVVDNNQNNQIQYENDDENDNHGQEKVNQKINNQAINNEQINDQIDDEQLINQTINQLNSNNSFFNTIDYNKAIKPDTDKAKELDYLLKNTVKNLDNSPDPFDSWFEVKVAVYLLNTGYTILPQYKIEELDFTIDMLVLDNTNYNCLAIECDGEHWHSGEEKQADDEWRQKMLEQKGFSFFRILENKFNANQDVVMDDLFKMLEEHNIFPE